MFSAAFLQHGVFMSGSVNSFAGKYGYRTTPQVLKFVNDVSARSSTHARAHMPAHARTDARQARQALVHSAVQCTPRQGKARIAREGAARRRRCRRQPPLSAALLSLALHVAGAVVFPLC